MPDVAGREHAGKARLEQEGWAASRYRGRRLERDVGAGEEVTLWVTLHAGRQPGGVRKGADENEECVRWHDLPATRALVLENEVSNRARPTAPTIWVPYRTSMVAVLPISLRR